MRIGTLRLRNAHPRLSKLSHPLFSFFTAYASMIFACHRTYHACCSPLLPRVAVIGHMTIARSGKTGSKGQTQEKEHETNADAIKYADKQAEEKAKKGFASASSSSHKRGGSSTSAAAPVESALNRYSFSSYLSSL